MVLNEWERKSVRASSLHHSILNCVHTIFHFAIFLRFISECFLVSLFHFDFEGAYLRRDVQIIHWQRVIQVVCLNVFVSVVNLIRVLIGQPNFVTFVRQYFLSYL